MLCHPTLTHLTPHESTFPLPLHSSPVPSTMYTTTSLHLHFCLLCSTRTTLTQLHPSLHHTQLPFLPHSTASPTSTSTSTSRPSPPNPRKGNEANSANVVLFPLFPDAEFLFPPQREFHDLEEEFWCSLACLSVPTFLPRKSVWHCWDIGLCWSFLLFWRQKFGVFLLCVCVWCLCVSVVFDLEDIIVLRC